VTPVILGTGAYRYRAVDDWARLPPGQELDADVAAVGVDAQDRVYAFNRGRHPMVVLVSPHGRAVDSRGDIYVGEVSFTNRGNRFKGPFPRGLRSLQELVKEPS
jgi:hypothetical protein